MNIPPAPHPILTGRLAPSPTGALHLGNARTFLLAWLSIRQRQGRLILRMEDLDHPKVKPAAAGQALEDLRWLGLDWDEGPELGGPHAPYTQTERIQHYADALNQLKQRGLTSPCTCSRKDVAAAQSAPHASDALTRYPGTCHKRFPSFEHAESTLPDGRLPVWRFHAPDRDVHFVDAFHGPVTINVHKQDGDFVLGRHRQGAGYMLAVVVDDAAMGITEVLRADDLLTATPRQILLQEALGLPTPTYCHVPLVVAADGRRLAKRHGDTRIATLREQGIPAEQVVGLLGWWCGIAAWGEQCRPSDLLARFQLASLPHTPALLTQEVNDYLSIT
jgi:glutamyl-tRNA synthetase